MGQFETSRMKQNKAIAKAHRMAEAFASHRSREFLKTFLKASGIPTWLFALTDSLTKVTNDLISLRRDAKDSSQNELEIKRLEVEIADLEHLISEHAANEEGILEDLLNDSQVDLHFGMAVALAYAMGYTDCDRGASLKQLYVPSEMADK